MGTVVNVRRVWKHGLRVVCILCGKEHRHFYERRLRHKLSSCCQAPMIPAWHISKSENGDYAHPREYQRAVALWKSVYRARQLALRYDSEGFNDEV